MRLMDLIKPILISEYDVPADFELRKAVCSMALTTVRPENLGPIQLTPHVDTSAYNQFAVLLYLCDEHHGGTAFCRHNATNYEVITMERSEGYTRYILPGWLGERKGLCILRSRMSTSQSFYR